MPGNQYTLLREHPRRLLWASLATLAVLAASLLIPVTERVTAPARVEGAIQRQVSAPVQGFIGAVNVRPGDTVPAGTLLLELDPREFDLERMKWNAKLAELEKRYSEALATEEQSDIAIARVELEQARAQLEIVDQKLARMSIRAPFDGVVISGDLTRSLGAPVQRGEALLTIAPLGEYRVIVEVDERDIEQITVGQHGRLVTTSAAGEALSLTIAAITPIAVSDTDGTRFEVEAFLSENREDVRPGLQGFAKVDTGTRPVLAQATKRLRQWLQVALWRWQL